MWHKNELSPRMNQVTLELLSDSSTRHSKAVLAFSRNMCSFRTREIFGFAEKEEMTLCKTLSEIQMTRHFSVRPKCPTIFMKNKTVQLTKFLSSNQIAAKHDAPWRKNQNPNWKFHEEFCKWKNKTNRSIEAQYPSSSNILHDLPIYDIHV